MDLEIFRNAVKSEGWIIKRKDGFFYFKRRDTSKAYNQGVTYSCKTRDAQEAIKTIQKWIVKGFPETRKEKKNAILFIDYLYSFWADDSSYVSGAAMEGRHITKSYTRQCRNYIRLYAEDYFKNTKLEDVNESNLNGFFDHVMTLRSKKTRNKYSASVLGNLKTVVLVPLRIGRQKGIIKHIIDFSIVFPHLSHRPQTDRGILTPEETTKLILQDWYSKKAYIAFCIAVNCGLRLGEIRGLRIGCIKDGFIIVNRSYNDIDGLKCPKNGHTRIVPCPDDLLRIIREYVETLPEDERGEDCFLLTHDMDASKPISKMHCRDSFYRELELLNIPRFRINALTGQTEKICFHSLRHQTATRWVESGIDLRLVASAMGHTVKMLEHYSDHLDGNDIKRLRQSLINCHALGIEKK